MPNPKIFNHYEWFDLYRGYVRHQYELINHRTGWYVSLQAFLFATFGFTIQKKLEVIGHFINKGSDLNLICANSRLVCENIGYLYFALVLFCVVGIAASTIFFLVMSAASVPIGHLFDLWEDHLKDAQLTDEERKKFPFLTGGTDRRYANRGRKVTLLLPVIIGTIWLLILITTQGSPLITGTSFLGYAIPDAIKEELLSTPLPCIHFFEVILSILIIVTVFLLFVRPRIKSSVNK